MWPGSTTTADKANHSRPVVELHLRHIDFHVLHPKIILNID